MIAACPKCQTRYRLKPEQIGEGGIRLRCRRCEVLFRVLPPPSEPAAAEAAAPAPPPVATKPAARSVPPSVATKPTAQPVAPPSPPPAAPQAPSAPVLLVALGQGDEGKRLADRFSIDGQRAVAVGDGAEALLSMHRNAPKVAILDAALGGLGGHAVCEVMKRSPLLQEVRVLLLQGTDAPSRDAAAEGFGADLYLDTSRSEDECEAALAAALTQWGLVVPALRAPIAPVPPGHKRSAPESSVSESVASAPAVAPTTTPEEAEEVERAERLARIAVSDIVLYNEEKFAAALRSADPLLAMRDEVAEGRALLRGRIAEAVFAQRDFVGEELLRLVRERA